MWPFNSSVTKMRGKIIRVREGLGDITLNISVDKAYAKTAFTGAANFSRLYENEVELAVRKIDTRKEEMDKAMIERLEVEKELKEEQLKRTKTNIEILKKRSKTKKD